MVFFDYVLLAGIGFFVGILAGFIGIGGNVVLIPTVLFFLKHRGIHESVLTHITYGSLLLVTMVTAISSTVRMHIQRLILWQLVPWIVFGSIIATQAMAPILRNLKGFFLQFIFAFILLILGIQWFLTRKQTDPLTTRNIKPLSLFITGILIGVISVLTGLGGGILLIPLLAGYFFVSTQYLAGTSSAVLVFTAFSAVLSYLWSGLGHPNLPKGAIGYILPQLSLVIAIGTVPGAQIGAKLNQKYAKKWFRLAFACIQILMSLWMFWNLKDELLSWLR